MFYSLKQSRYAENVANCVKEKRYIFMATSVYMQVNFWKLTV